MRHRDLFGLSIVLALAIEFGREFFLPGIFQQLGIPSGFFPFLITTSLLTAILDVMLTPLNNRFRQWRKEHGRDIEEEERYETKDGMIKLTPNEITADDSSPASSILAKGNIFHK